MGRQFFVNILVLVGVLLPQLAGALGLGNITPHSSLNQPLRAEIKLVQVRGLEQREILVSLAAQEHFDRYGVDRPYFLSDLKFEVDLQAVGGPIVIVTSRKPVREPYLNFILQAQWPSGKLLKEFTVLLDLPVYADTQSGTAVQGTTSQFAAQPEPEVSQAPAAEIAPEVEESAVMEHISLRENPRSSFTPEEPASEAPPSEMSREELPSRNRPNTQTVAAPALAGSEDYTVRSGDTLWEIAARTRPDRAVSVQQTMLAIQRLNAEAFIDSNINLLKKGQVLRIPDREEIVGVAPQRAVEEVAIQNQEWSSGSAEFSDVQLDATNVRESSSVAEASQEGRLKLTSPEESVDSLEGRASGGGESSSAALENELAITLEQMDMAGKESGELRSKIAALEEQIETADKLIAISNQELRAMELAAEMAASASEELATTEELVPTEASETLASSEQNEIVFPEPNELTASAEDEFVSAADEIAATYEQAEMGDQGDSAFATAGSETMTEEPVLADAESAPTEEEEQKPAEASAPVPTPAAPGKSIVTRIMDNLLYIGIGLLALVILAFLFIRSRADDGFEDEDFLQDMNFEESASEFDVEQALTEEAENIENFAEEAVQEATEEVHAEAQTEDVGAEADIYIAYGKYDQAEEILLKSLENEPENTDIRLKLLEVYATQRDGEKFDNNLSLLHEMGAADAVSRANQLRSGIPDLAPYGADSVDSSGDQSPSDALAQADDSLDFSLGVGQEEGGESEASLELELDEDLDFDLDTVSEEVEGGELDFDLGGDDLDRNDDDLVIDLDSGEENAQSLNDGNEQSSSALIEDDLAADIEPLEFDLGSGDTEVVGEELLDTNASTETADHDLDFDLELSTDSADDFSEVADGALDFLEDSDDDSTLITPAVTDADVSAADELGLEGTDLDLSSLDQELDALTGDGDLDFDGDLGLEEDPLETEASSLNMEEPVIDFDVDDASPEVAASQPEPNAELDQALADIPRSEMNFDLPEIDPEAADDDADLGFLSDSDETATKLDLARAYIDMGDAEGAKDIISEILSEGNEQQKTEASSLLQRLA